MTRYRQINRVNWFVAFALALSPNVQAESKPPSTQAGTTHDEQPAAAMLSEAFLLFLADSLEVDGEWIDPLSMQSDVIEDSAMVETTTSEPSANPVQEGP